MPPVTRPVTREQPAGTGLAALGGTTYRHSRRGPVVVSPAGGRGGNPRLPDRSHGLRRSAGRRLLTAVVSLLLLTGIGFGLLLALTPGVGDAPARVATQTRGGGLLVGSPPLRVQQALVATEDSRFYSHSGVDPIGSLRAVLGPLLGQADPGGATLDQQLAKLLYTGGRRTLTDRIEQVALAVKIDHRYSKPEILRLYLDTAYFGHSYTGIAAAARGYFGRRPQDLSWTQASMLAGLVQAPSAYDPFTHLALARSRQRHVLDRLVATRVLTRSAADAAYAAPLRLVSGG